MAESSYTLRQQNAKHSEFECPNKKYKKFDKLIFCHHFDFNLQNYQRPWHIYNSNNLIKTRIGTIRFYFMS